MAHYKAMCVRAMEFYRNAQPRHWFIAVVSATLLLGALLPPGGATTVLGPTLTMRLADGITTRPPAVAPAPLARPVGAPTALTRRVITVQHGDTLSGIFDTLDLGATTLAKIMRLDAAQALQRLRPGNQLVFSVTSDGQLARLRAAVHGNKQITIARNGRDYRASQETLPVLKRTAYARGQIKSSLFQAAKDAGLPDNLTMELIHLFAWDIDFAHDVRPGNTFTVIYQHTYSAQKGSGDGPILAARFTTQGHVYTAIRYTDAGGETGYYTVDGHNVRKAFLRAPVDYTRISSGFSLHRMNPVLHYVRPHYGTDFAAPQGTPIHATADGTIIYRARKGGYGNAVVIKHAGRFSTLYGHMSRFARGQHVGSVIHQGDIIGYVGHTGIATGPHVHYEFRVNGIHKDPLKIKLPDAKPIAKQYRAAYKKYATSLIAQLESVRNIMLAAR